MAKHRLRDEWLDRIKAVEREFLVAQRAAEVFITVLNRGESKLPPKTDVQDAHAMSDNLEGTYFIRLFAAFESGLRNYYATLKGTTPGTKDLIDAIATRRRVPDELWDEVHEVREYRNVLVHAGGQQAEPISISDARSRLCQFFSWLPDNWEP